MWDGESGRGEEGEYELWDGPPQFTDEELVNAALRMDLAIENAAGRFHMTPIEYARRMGFRDFSGSMLEDMVRVRLWFTRLRVQNVLIKAAPQAYLRLLQLVWTPDYKTPAETQRKACAQLLRDANRVLRLVGSTPPEDIFSIPTSPPLTATELPPPGDVKPPADEPPPPATPPPPPPPPLPSHPPPSLETGVTRQARTVRVPLPLPRPEPDPHPVAPSAAGVVVEAAAPFSNRAAEAPGSRRRNRRAARRMGRLSRQPRPSAKRRVVRGADAGGRQPPASVPNRTARALERRGKPPPAGVAGSLTIPHPIPAGAFTPSRPIPPP